MDILFLCTGNTCRSNMAEAIFNKFNKNEEIKSYSAGTSIEYKSQTSLNTNYILKNELGLDIKDRYAVLLNYNMVESSTLILTMTKKQKEVVKNEFPEFKGKMFSLNEYVNKPSDIKDPYGGNLNVYLETYNDILSSIILLINKLKEDSGTIYM
ncbi:MAG: low molecular weight protein arginine phosphatase [Clostridiaceae bacterium]